MPKAKDTNAAKDAARNTTKTSKPAATGRQVAKTVSPRSGMAATRPAPKTAPDAPPTQPASGSTRGNTAARLSPEDVYRLIQESAYFKAKARGFAPGHEVQDW